MVSVKFSIMDITTTAKINKGIEDFNKTIRGLKMKDTQNSYPTNAECRFLSSTPRAFSRTEHMKARK
jgi:hypothetical protein